MAVPLSRMSVCLAVPLFDSLSLCLSVSVSICVFSLCLSLAYWGTIRREKKRGCGDACLAHQPRGTLDDVSEQRWLPVSPSIPVLLNPSSPAQCAHTHTHVPRVSLTFTDIFLSLQLPFSRHQEQRPYTEKDPSLS